ncbi:ATP-binding protein [Mesorhizobium sp.]|nr:ATP-binding protein [Mesorhizobium sp.]
MSTTILNRLMHHCHLLEFEGRSYRLEEAADAPCPGNKVKLNKSTSVPCG